MVRGDDQGSDLIVQGGELDGTSWAVQFSSDPSHTHTGDAYRDTFIFKEGVVTCKEDAALGFDPTEYEFNVWPSSITFAMIQAANRQGKKSYAGVVQNHAMSGTLAWDPELGKTQYYVFQGTEIGHPKAKK